MLMVVAIISILLSLLAAAVHGARRRSYTAIAMTESQQIAEAIKSHWIAYGKWPGNWPVGAETKVTRAVAEVLKLETSNYSFEAGGEEDDALLDPWGRPYMIKIPEPVAFDDAVPDVYQTNIHFMNTEMFYYHEY